MSLADFYDPNGEHSKYLVPGNHPVTIKGHRSFRYNSGSPGVELELQDDLGRVGKYAFCCKKEALWKLANFAADLGLTKQQMANIDPETGNGMQAFRGKRFVAIVEKPEKYSEVVDWVKASALQAPEAPPADLPPHTPTDDKDIPF